MSKAQHLTRIALMGAIAVVGMLFAPSEAKAVVVPVPYFAPISDCGTVGTVPGYLDLDGDGIPEPCRVWFADSGGVYFFGGLDVYDDGDRIYVDGQVCLICLTTCPAAAIFYAVISACPGR